MKITIDFTNSIKIVEAKKGSRLLNILLDNGAKIDTDCGGRGRCNKCKVKLVSGAVSGQEKNKDGYILSCLAYVEDEDIEVKVDSVLDEDLVNHEKTLTGNFGIAFDLGTTTLAFSLVNTDTKEVVDTYSVLNKQSVFGADVISRISAANEGHLDKLQEIILNQVRDSIRFFKKKYNIDKIDSVVVAGNTTMLHLFLGVSPESIGVSPYKPQFVDYKVVKGKDLNVDCNTLQLLPSFSGYVGADITAGVYALDLQDDEILVDLGTNGEIIYKTHGDYYATSTAAGPCLEGACFDCGIGGVDGAISKFEINDDGSVDYKTINDYKPTGICGAGLVDIMANLLRLDIVDETGALNLENDKYQITDDIFLSAKDVREFQLAKSAICSGIKVLLKDTGMDINSIKKFYIAGGIGYHINLENAIYTGILPCEAEKKVYVAGNSSLIGAIKCLTEEGAAKKMEEIASTCEIIELNNSASFGDEYVNNMFFTK